MTLAIANNNNMVYNFLNNNNAIAIFDVAVKYDIQCPVTMSAQER